MVRQTRARGKTIWAILLSAAVLAAAASRWKHLSSASGDLPAPNAGTQQTSATVFDADAGKSACQVDPCGGYSEKGACDGTKLQICDLGQAAVYDCKDNNQTCGPTGDGHYDCK